MDEIPFPGWFSHRHQSVPDQLEKQQDTLDFLLRSLERLIHMSGTLSEQFEAARAEIVTGLDGVATTVSAIATDTTEIGADVDMLLSNATPGEALTQAQVDAMTSIRDRVVATGTALAAAKDALDAVNAKVPAPPAP